MPIPDIEIDEEFVELVKDELVDQLGTNVAEELDDAEIAEISRAVIKIARLRSGENFA